MTYEDREVQYTYDHPTGSSTETTPMGCLIRDNLDHLNVGLVVARLVLLLGEKFNISPKQIAEIVNPELYDVKYEETKT